MPCSRPADETGKKTNEILDAPAFRPAIEVDVCLKCCLPCPVISVFTDLNKFHCPMFLAHSGYNNSIAAMCAVCGFNWSCLH